MNERLLELAKQANANELSYAYYRGEKKPENAVTLHSVDLEKFAELIVGECLTEVKKEHFRRHQEQLDPVITRRVNATFRS